MLVEAAQKGSELIPLKENAKARKQTILQEEMELH